MLKKILKYRPQPDSNTLLLVLFFVCCTFVNVNFSYHGDRLDLDGEIDLDEAWTEQHTQQLDQAQDDADETHANHGMRSASVPVIGLIALALTSRGNKKPKDYLKTISLDDYIELRVAMDEKDAQLHLTQAQATAPVQSHIQSDSQVLSSAAATKFVDSQIGTSTAIQPLYSDKDRNT